MKYLRLLLLTLCTAPVCAEEAAIYESVDDIAIGRIFLTSEQRSWLDVKRLEPRSESFDSSSADDSVQSESVVSTSPAGFIIRSDGNQRIWRDGEFVAGGSSSLESMRFPRTVTVIRHAVPNVDQPPSHAEAEKPGETDHDGGKE